MKNDDISSVNDITRLLNFIGRDKMAIFDPSVTSREIDGVSALALGCFRV